MFKRISIITIAAFTCQYFYLQYLILVGGDPWLLFNFGIFIIFGILNTIAVMSAFDKKYKKIIDESRHDNLTGTLGRTMLVDKIEAEQYRTGRAIPSYSIIMFDVDHFKKVNDNYGHAAGDEVLKHITSLFNAHIRKIDMIGRWGGEEFIILLPITELPGAVVLAEKLRILLEATPAVWKQYKIAITASFGVTQGCVSDTNGAGTIERADAEMYRAKSSGRNRVCAHDMSQEEIKALATNA